MLKLRCILLPCRSLVLEMPLRTPLHIYRGRHILGVVSRCIASCCIGRHGGWIAWYLCRRGNIPPILGRLFRGFVSVGYYDGQQLEQTGNNCTPPLVVGVAELYCIYGFVDAPACGCGPYVCVFPETAYGPGPKDEVVNPPS